MGKTITDQLEEDLAGLKKQKELIKSGELDRNLEQVESTITRIQNEIYSIKENNVDSLN